MNFANESEEEEGYINLIIFSYEIIDYHQEILQNKKS